MAFQVSFSSGPWWAEKTGERIFIPTQQAAPISLWQRIWDFILRIFLRF